ncbi:hypothetical protein [Rhodococcus koreensis]
MNRAHTPKAGVHIHPAHGGSVTPAERTTLEAAGAGRLCRHCDSAVDVYVMLDGAPDIVVRHRPDCPQPRRRLSSSTEGNCGRT